MGKWGSWVLPPTSPAVLTAESESSYLPVDYPRVIILPMMLLVARGLGAQFGVTHDPA